MTFFNEFRIALSPRPADGGSDSACTRTTDPHFRMYYSITHQNLLLKEPPDSHIWWSWSNWPWRTHHQEHVCNRWLFWYRVSFPCSPGLNTPRPQIETVIVWQTQDERNVGLMLGACSDWSLSKSRWFWNQSCMQTLFRRVVRVCLYCSTQKHTTRKNQYSYLDILQCWTNSCVEHVHSAHFASILLPFDLTHTWHSLRLKEAASKKWERHVRLC